MQTNHSSKGFTLLEVLIALLVFSLGLLGMAGMLSLSVKTTHVAYQRTQASFLAQAMADRMHANVLGVWNGNYALTGSATNTGTIQACTSGTACTVSQVATRDLQLWDNQLLQFLPTPSRSITCPATNYTLPSPLPTADQQILMPPYATFCEIDITWSEAAVDRGITTPPQETLSWVFQP
jgi:type IV pilus assembly protein PilV